MSNNSVYSTSFPNPSELLSVFATINSYDDNKKSYYNQIILKCRQLIFEMPEIIAFPQTKYQYGIYIVIKDDFYKSGDLHRYLEKHSLRSGSAQTVQISIFEKCCFYTIISKLAPKWNQISNYLVCGRNFLTNEDVLDSVQLKLNIKDKGDTRLSICANHIKLSKITLDNLHLTEDELKELETNQYIRFTKYNTRSIQVLPSLNRGYIIGLHLKLSNNCSIQTYQEMRRYWKNTYGYRLPESDEDIFFVEISFFEGSHILTYPSLCVRFYESIYPQKIDSNHIKANFMASLKKYVPTILSENYPDPNLIVNNSQEVKLPSSCEINTTNKDITEKINSTCENENNQFTNEAALKSKLSQLLEELNKQQTINTIYLTPVSSNNNFNYIDNYEEIEESVIENTPKNKNEFQSKSISENLKEQLEFLTNSISQRASSSQTHTPELTNKLTQKFRAPLTNIKTLAKGKEIQETKDFVPIKKRRIVSKSP